MAFLSQTKYLFKDSNTYLFDRKFDTALRGSTIEKFIADKDCATLDDKLIWTHHPHAEQYRRDTTILPSILLDILTGVIGSRLTSSINHQNQKDVIRKNIQIQLGFILENVTLHNVTHLLTMWDKIIDQTLQDRTVPTLLNVYQELNQNLEQLPNINKYHTEDVTEDERLMRKTSVNHCRLTNIQMEWWWSNKICVIKYKNEHWLLPRPILQEISAKLGDTLSVILYAKLARYSVLDTNADFQIKNYIIELCKLHIRCPDKFFKIIANLEGLAVAEILKRTEDWMNKELLDSIVEDVKESTGVNIEHETIFTNLSYMSVPMIAEIGTLSKITGHPLVDMAGGAAKLYYRVQERFPVYVEAVASCINHIKQNYILNFIARYHRWPNVTLDEKTNPLLKAAHARGISPNDVRLRTHYGAPSLEDWSYITIEKEIEFDYCENILPMLDDKALSVLRSKVVESYFSNKRPSAKDTRLLLFYLFSDDKATDHVNYLRQYAQSDEDMNLVLDHMVIRVVPKEKELKELFRGFGCKTLMDRCRGIVQEKNAARYLTFFSDEQAISISELELVKKIYALLNLKRVYKHHKIFYINFDASGWNNKFRNPTVKPVMRQTLDRIHGLPIFSKTHDSYEKSKIYIPDDFYELWWDGQLGGIEGLNQDTWMITYLGQIKYAFQGLIDQFHLLAKGDDLRAAVPIPVAMVPKGDASSTAAEFKARVCDAAKKYGHEIKIQESYISENLFTFSKSMFFHKVPLSYCCRKIQKTHGETNIFLPTLDSYISSSFSNAHGSCQSTSVHIPQYIVGLYWTTANLLLHPLYKNCSVDELLTLTLVPSPVGGFPIIYLHNMLVRAESDLLSSFVALVKYCQKKSLSIYPLMERFLRIKTSIDKKSYGQLLMDPYSLPIRKPQGPEPFLRRLLRRRLLHANIKPEVKEILALPDHPSYEQLINIFKDGPIWWAKVYSAIYDSSVYALSDKLTMQFVTAKSLLDAFLVSGTKRRRFEKFLRDAMQKDINVNLWRIQIMRGYADLAHRPYIVDLDCPTEITQTLRDEMWGMHIATVTHPSIPHQISIKNPELHVDSYDIDNHFVLTFKYNDSPPHLPNSIHYTLGPFEPFLGSTTSAGNLVPSLRVTQKDPLCASILNLCMLHSHTNSYQATDDGDIIVSNVPDLIDILLTSYTEETSKDLAPFSFKKKSGTQTHRLRTHGFNESIMPNSNYTLYTQCQGETNTHQFLRLDPQDFTVNFLHILCHANIVSRLDSQSSKLSQCPQEVWVITRDCDYCMKPIKELPIFLNDQLLANFYPPRLALSYVKEPALNILKQSMIEFQRKHPHIVEQQQGESDFLDCCDRVSLHWIYINWKEGVQSATRYGIYRHTQEIIAVTKNLLGQNILKVLGETEVKLIPPEALVYPLALFVLYDMSIERSCTDVTSLESILSTAHLDGFHLYSLLLKLQAYGRMADVVQYLSTHSETSVITGALHNLELATRFCIPILYKLGLTILNDAIIIPIYNEVTLESLQPLLSVLYALEDIMILSQIKDLLSQEDYEVDHVLYLYITYLFPRIPINELLRQIQEQNTRLCLRDRESFDYEQLTCILEERHPKYKLINNWLREHIMDIDQMLEPLSTDVLSNIIEDASDMVLTVIPTYKSLSQDIDQIRSTRYSVTDPNGHLDMIDVDIIQEVPRLQPNPILSKIYIPQLHPIHTLTSQSIGFHDKNTVYSINVRPTLSMTAMIFGSLDIDYGVNLMLIMILNIRNATWKSLSSIVIINDRGNLLLQCLSNLSTSAHFYYHCLFGDKRTPPPLIAGISYCALVAPNHVHNKNAEIGLTNLLQPSTWVTLFQDVPRTVNLIWFRHDYSIGLRDLNQIYIQLCENINQRIHHNLLTIIETDIRCKDPVYRLCTMLAHIHLQVSVIKIEFDPVKTRLYIIGYGRLNNPISVVSLYPHKANVHIATELDNFHDLMSSSSANHEDTTNVYQTLSLMKTMIGRLRGKYPQVKLRLFDLIIHTHMLPMRAAHSEQTWDILQGYLLIAIRQELADKQLIITGETREVSNVAADLTLRHKLEVIKRSIHLHYLSQILNHLNPMTDNPEELLISLPTQLTIWNNLCLQPSLSNFLTINMLGVVSSQNYRITMTNIIYSVYELFYCILGTYWIYHDNKLRNND